MISLTPADAGQVRRDLGPKVPGGLALRTDLGQHQPENVIDYFPALNEFHRRDDHAFLEDLLERAHGRRRSAPNVYVVRQAGRVSGQLAVPVDGSDEADVVEMHAAPVRVVGEDHVPRAELVGAVAPDRPGHVLHEGPKVDGLGERLGDDPHVRVEVGAREVLPRLYVGGVRASPQSRGHLFGGLREGVADDLEPDGIDLILA